MSKPQCTSIVTGADISRLLTKFVILEDQYLQLERQSRWHRWPDELGGEYPPDSVPVLVFEKHAGGEGFLISAISKSRGVMGPSFAKAWRLIDPPDLTLQEFCPECGGHGTIESAPAGAGHEDDLAEHLPCATCLERADAARGVR